MRLSYNVAAWNNFARWVFFQPISSSCIFLVEYAVTKCIFHFVKLQINHCGRHKKYSLEKYQDKYSFGVAANVENASLVLRLKQLDSDG